MNPAPVSCGKTMVLACPLKATPFLVQSCFNRSDDSRLCNNGAPFAVIVGALTVHPDAGGPRDVPARSTPECTGAVPIFQLPLPCAAAADGDRPRSAENFGMHGTRILSFFYIADRRPICLSSFFHHSSPRASLLSWGRLMLALL